MTPSRTGCTAMSCVSYLLHCRSAASSSRVSRSSHSFSNASSPTFSHAISLAPMTHPTTPWPNHQRRLPTLTSTLYGQHVRLVVFESSRREKIITTDSSVIIVLIKRWASVVNLLVSFVRFSNGLLWAFSLRLYGLRVSLHPGLCSPHMWFARTSATASIDFPRTLEPFNLSGSTISFTVDYIF